jgi:methanogenic corrinoid protein MtbC1
MSDSTSSPPLVSIGAIARATGVPVETIRTWERRYGYPVPVRLPSGHRRYPADAVTRLALVKRAMDQGHRPSTVVAAEPDALRALLSISANGDSHPTAPPPLETSASFPDGWIELVAELDGNRLSHTLLQAWSALGAYEFVEQRLGPFLVALGDAWAKGRISVRHEHYASEIVREFLASQWRPMIANATGPVVVCATLEGEHHVLGLHIVALIAAMAGARVVFLGADSPVTEVVDSTLEVAAAGLILSCSLSARREHVIGQLRTLREELPSTTSIAVGGAGAPEAPPGVVAPRDFRALSSWVSAL